MNVKLEELLTINVKREKIEPTSLLTLQGNPLLRKNLIINRENSAFKLILKKITYKNFFFFKDLMKKTIIL